MDGRSKGRRFGRLLAVVTIVGAPLVLSEAAVVRAQPDDVSDVGFVLTKYVGNENGGTLEPHDFPMTIQQITDGIDDETIDEPIDVSQLTLGDPIASGAPTDTDSEEGAYAVDIPVEDNSTEFFLVSEAEQPGYLTFGWGYFDGEECSGSNLDDSGLTDDPTKIVIEVDGNDSQGGAALNGVSRPEGGEAGVACGITNYDSPMDLALTKSDGGATPRAGDTFNYTLTVTNNGFGPGDDEDPFPTVTDILPDQMEWVSPAPDGCEINGQELDCTLSSNPANGEVVTFTAAARVLPSTPVGSYTNEAWVDSDTDPVCGNSDGEVGFDRSVQSVPSSTPNTDQQEIDGPCGGPLCESDFAAGTSQINQPNGCECPLARSAPAATAPAAVSPGSDCDTCEVLPVSATTSTPSADSEPCEPDCPHDDWPSAETLFADYDVVPSPFDNVDCVDTEVTTSAQVSLSKTDDTGANGNPHPGGTVTYSLVGTNNGPSDLSAVQLTDDLPDVESFVSLTAGSGWTCNNADPISCDYSGDLAPGDAPPVEVVARVSSDFLGSSVSNTANMSATVGAAQEEFTAPNSLRTNDAPTPVIATATATDVVQVQRDSDITLTKTASAGAISAGDPFTWTLVVGNGGPDTAVNLTVTDPVPGPLVVQGATSSDFTCSVSGNTVTCTRPSLLVGATGTILITTLVPVGTTVQSFTNLASVALVGSDPVLPNNSSQQQVMIGSEAPVVLPATGRNTSAPLTTGGVMLLAGVGCLGVSKRRRKA